MAHDDAIDRLLAAWARARPDLDASPLGLIGRVLILARRLEQSVEESLAEHGLSLGAFDILATLRRAEPRGLTPSELLEGIILSSGGMTARLDKLSLAKWIDRRTDPDDRRKVVITLTAAGRKLIDRATETRFEEARDSIPAFEPKERATLEGLLKRWLCHVERE